MKNQHVIVDFCNGESKALFVWGLWEIEKVTYDRKEINSVLCCSNMECGIIFYHDF